MPRARSDMFYFKKGGTSHVLGLTSLYVILLFYNSKQFVSSSNGINIKRLNLKKTSGLKGQQVDAGFSRSILK